MIRHTTALSATLVLLGSVIAANYFTTNYGFIPVGFGLAATAGTFFAGFALAARDAIYDLWGRWPVLLIIFMGTVLSYALASPEIATASAAAFLLAELMDYAVYVPLRRRSQLGDRRWIIAVVASNVVGAFMDTVVFLGLAFGVASIAEALPGQMVGKTYATAAYLLVGFLIAKILKTRRRSRG